MKRSMVHDEPIMDMNNPMEPMPGSGSVSAPAPPVMHNFMPMPSLEFPFFPTIKEDDEDARELSFMQILRQNLEFFWQHQMMEINVMSDFKSPHPLPLARVKKIMKSDPEVKMISADTPVLFSKACEIFILEVTLRAWLQTEASNRRTLQRCDICRALRRGDVFDFLIDVVPHESCDPDNGDEEETVFPSQIAPAAAIQPAFPLLNMNVMSGANQIAPDLVMPDQEVSPEHMFRPYMPSAGLNFDPGFK